MHSLWIAFPQNVHRSFQVCPTSHGNNDSLYLKTQGTCNTVKIRESRLPGMIADCWTAYACSRTSNKINLPVVYYRQSRLYFSFCYASQDFLYDQAPVHTQGLSHLVLSFPCICHVYDMWAKSSCCLSTGTGIIFHNRIYRVLLSAEWHKNLL